MVVVGGGDVPLNAASGLGAGTCALNASTGPTAGLGEGTSTGGSAPTPPPKNPIAGIGAGLFAVRSWAGAGAGCAALPAGSGAGARAGVSAGNIVATPVPAGWAHLVMRRTEGEPWFWSW